MKVNLYTIRDRVAEQCGPVFQAVNHGVASRNVVRLMEKIPKYDHDAFRLWWIGIYDDGTGDIEPMSHVEIDVNIPRFEDTETRQFNFEESANG